MSNDEVIKRVDKAMSLNEEIKQLKAQLEKAESVIEYYKNGCNGEDDCTYGNIMKSGKRAREYFSNKKAKC